MKIFRTILLISLFSCAQNPEKHEQRVSSQDLNLNDLKRQVLELQGTIEQINNFVASDFTTCSLTLPAFEQKICQIAQTATAEQEVTFVGQLQQVAKVLQTQIYGIDCINGTDPGCPISGSILSNIAAVQASEATDSSNISSIQTSISTIQTNITALQTSVTGLQTRLNNFNGSGSSVETIITGIQSSITTLNSAVAAIPGIQSSISTLNSEVAAIQSAISSGNIYKTIFLCSNISASGPIFEPVLIKGNNTEVSGYVSTTTGNGMGVVCKAGVTGTVFLSTASNTKACNFKIYDKTTYVKLCWDKSNRSQTTGGIDTACDSVHNFANPTANCTCAN
jgi:prefoldin subunit 5